MIQDITPIERVANALGLSRFDIAQMVDATPGIVEAWLSGEITPGLRSRQKLEELLLVLEGLFAKMVPGAAARWLTTPNPALDYYEPLDLLRRGNLNEVMHVIEVMPRAIRLDRLPSMETASAPH